MNIKEGISNLPYSGLSKIALLMEKYVDLLHQRISSLKEGEKLILPYGYLEEVVHNINSLESPGHMTLLEIKRGSASRAKIRLFNTGEGVTAEKHRLINKTSAYPWEKSIFFDDISNKEF